MRFLALLIFLFFCAFALVARWYYICEIKQLCDEVATETVIPARESSLKLTESGAVILRNFDQFKFGEGISRPKINDNNAIFIDTLAYYLKKYPAKNLEITAYFSGSEKGKSQGFYENLGISRAAEVRRLLVSRGIEEARVTLDYGLQPADQLNETLNFQTYIPEGLDEFEKRAFTFKNMTFSDGNFKLDSDSFDPGPALRQYADSVANYLEANKNKTLTIIAHTDKIGDNDYNKELGLKRAKSVKQYLLDQYKISDKRIEAKSEGEDRPAADNTTHEGRQKNRRINFILQ